MTQITIIRPDDFHLHLRDGAGMADVLRSTAGIFSRAMIMPNLRPPVCTIEDAQVYRERILSALPEDLDFLPLMSLYLRNQTTEEEIRRAAESGIVAAAKLYPAGATTNSESGVTDLGKMHGVFMEMSAIGMPLMVHGEVTDPAVDIFDRERVFLERVFGPFVEKYPDLKIVLEHASTRDAVDFVRTARPGLGATLTAHHLSLSRNDIFSEGLNPHHYCLPVLKSETDRLALIKAAVSGNPRFFAGTDSAPHDRREKEKKGGAAGIYSAPVALAMYAEIFDHEDALDRLEAFMSQNGAAFYGLQPNKGMLRLEKVLTAVPEDLPFGEGRVVPLRAGRDLQWKVFSGEKTEGLKNSR